jgi:hypothetical protein
MNATYERYLKDENFRAGILAAARRERARAIGEFFSKAFRFKFFDRNPANASRAHFARQG